MLDVRIADPYRTPISVTRLGRVRDRLVDPATWKDLAYLLLLMPLGIASFLVVVSLRRDRDHAALAAGLGVVRYPTASTSGSSP